MQNIPRENEESESLANWLRWNNYFFTHIANESWLPPKVAMLASKRKKRMWLSPWFPDFCIVLKRRSLLFIEMKRQKKILKNWTIGKSPSVTSEEQIMWQNQLWSIENVESLICYWANEAIQKIKELEDF